MAIRQVRDPGEAAPGRRLLAGHLDAPARPFRGGRRTHFEKLERVSGVFHDYAMEWTPDGIDFFYDGRPVARFAKGQDGSDASVRGWPFDKPFFLILNVAVGGNWGGPIDESMLPFVMEVEHVRVYQKD